MIAVIEAFGKAIGQFSHVIRDSPELVFPLLFNRLQWQTEELPGLSDRLAKGEASYARPWFRLISRAAIQRSLMRTLIGDGGYIVVSALSPDGKKIVSSGAAKPRNGFISPTIRIWNAETGQEIAAIQNHLRDYVWGLIFTRDSKRFLSVSAKKASIRSAATGELILEFDALFSSGILRHLDRALSPSGREMVIAAPDGVIKIMDIESGEVKAALKGSRGDPLCLAFSPDGERIAAFLPGRAMMWDVRSETPIWSADIPKAGTACAFSPDGSRVAIAKRGAADCGDVHDLIMLLDAESGRVVAMPSGYVNELNDCVFSPDGKRLAMAGAEGRVFIWDGKTGQPLGASSGSWGPISTCEFSPDGRLIVSGCGEYYDLTEYALDLWDVASMKKVSSLTGHGSHTEDCRYSPDGKLILSTGADGEIKLWDAGRAEGEGIPDRHEKWVSACRYSPDGKWIVSSSDDRTLKVWDSATGQSRFTLLGHTDQILDCWFAPDGRSILSANQSDSLIIWDVAQRKERSRLDCAKHGRTFGLSPDGRFLACVKESVLECWNIADAEKLKFSRKCDHKINACAFSPDGARIVTGGRNGDVLIWDAASGQKIMAIKGHEGNILSCTFSPEGRMILTAGKNPNLCLWDAETGQKIFDFPSRSGNIASCAFSPDGRRALSGGGDKALRLWDTLTGRQISDFIGFSGAILACAFSPDGTQIVAGDIQGQVLIYRLSGSPVGS